LKTESIYGISYGIGKFVMMGSNGFSSVSKNGYIWKNNNLGKEKHFEDIVFDGKKFVTVGLFGLIMVSNDGLNWYEKKSNTLDSLHSIHYNDKYISVGSEGTIIRSDNGEKWVTSFSKSNENLNDVSYGNEMFIVVGDRGTILNSKDGGKNWDQIEINTRRNLNGIYFYNN
jgi:photosystem II stability/assembly factor-like uncharacterized protein